ncbi:helix-turn-helix domain-containing protein [Spongiactinospora sp. TRM90649]|uniref:helix-turn-helix domain-containing protein n=1 Tax=Spongiactinospora sp. TRM90649 TaxID=3031114 RepID=UPI0023F82415|nr:helix-turn-helix domain-containing protein [Spongiactinospora sp. TRM90649]MDF5754247.1 helix-turn-helix domain-containing protein [Spongiactinospora sp. TRM90649]
MGEISPIGLNLKAARHAQRLSQEGLAAKAGISKDVIQKLEQGRRQSCRITTLMKLANALDVDLTELTGKRERLGGDRDGGSVLAIRNVLLSPSLMPGMEGLDDRDTGVPTPLPDLRAAVRRAWGEYWAGNLGAAVASVPGLINEARLTHEALGAQAAAPLAESYQLASGLMEHFGRMDLAALAAERGVVAAAKGSDPLQWAMVQRSYGWVLLNQARADEAERLATFVARRIEPTFSAPALEVAVWGNVLISAMWAALAADKPVTDYIRVIAAAAERVGERLTTYQTTFSRSRASMHIVHADARHDRTAEKRLEEARALSPVWFRHQLTAQSIVADIRERQTRPTSAIRSLSRSLGLDDL